MWAAIPYTTFPTIDLGPLQLRTFGLMVGLGVVVGTIIASRLGERVGIDRDETIRLGTRMVLAGVVGSRLTWVLTHLDQIDSPIDVIAVWEGGLQFSGGFITAVLVGIPSFRRWTPTQRWTLLDGMALGLTVGMFFGRIGCYAVGEHLGGRTSFFLGTRYDGGPTREGPLVVGEVIHNTALYEMFHLVPLAALLWWLLVRRRTVPSTTTVVFLVWYGTARLLTDLLRTYDDTLAGLTGAQWLCLGLLLTAVWVVVRVRPSLRDAGAETDESRDPGDDVDGEPSADGSDTGAATPAP